MGNSINNLFAGNLLGSNKGTDFAWKDVTAVKVGASYVWNENLTVRRAIPIFVSNVVYGDLARVSLGYNPHG